MTNPVLQNCPDCNRALYFLHNETTLLHCQCGSTLVRSEGQIISKPFYTVAQPTDFIQPGTEGIWKGKSFRVLGRVRAWIEEFVFNYWTIAFEDGSLSYLGEGYGLYAVYERTFVNEQVNSSLLDSLKIASKRSLFGPEEYILERKYTCYKWELEGEAWFPHLANTFRTFEFAFPSGQRIELIEPNRNILLSFTVYYTNLNELQLKNTRTPGTQAKTLSCKKCQRENNLVGFPFCQSFACIHCGTRYSLENGVNFKQVAQNNQTDAGPDLALGTKGKMKGIDYEVIGYAQKEESNQYRSQWKEYTLYNQTYGFAFLSEFSGHWTFIRERGDAPVLTKEQPSSINFEKENFELFNNYEYSIVNAQGEFPYNAFNDGDKRIREFISPPEVWIQEKSGKEGIIWFLGEHITTGELKNAFGDNIVLPWRSGVGAVEPKGFVSLEKIVRFGIAAILLLVLTHLITSFSHEKRLLSENTYAFTDSTDTVSFIKNNINLDKSSSNLEFVIYADVDNSWCEVGVTLVDVAKGTEYTVEQGVEYYYGYTDGESWREGDKKETAYLSQIPAGNYDMIIRGMRERKYQFDAYSGGSSAPNLMLQNFHMLVYYDTTNDRNLFFCIIPLVLWPFIHFLIIRNNERRRWYNSPFSPYSYNDED